MKSLLLFIFTFCSILASSQRIENIASENIRALGGYEFLKNLQNLDADVEVIKDGKKYDGKLYILNEVAYRLDLKVGDYIDYVLLTPEAGEYYFPSEGMTMPVDMDGEEYRTSLYKLKLRGFFFDFDPGKQPFEVMKGGKIEDDAPLIEVSFYNDMTPHPSVYSINSKTMLVKSITRFSQGNLELVEDKTTFSDYKTSKDGLVYPAKIQDKDQTILIKKVKINQDLPIDMFTIKNEQQRIEMRDNPQNDEGSNPGEEH